MKSNPSAHVQRRTWLIIGSLALVGVVSLIARVLVKNDYSALDALLDLGNQALPAALLFLLINYSIDRYERRAENRLNLLRRLRGEEGASASTILNDLAKGNHITEFDLSDTPITLDLRLQDKTLSNGKLNRCDLDRSAFTQCILKSLAMRASSLRLAVMEKCRLESVKFDGSDLTGTLFVDCDFGLGCTFVECNLHDVRFKRCTFELDVLRSMRPEGARFISCRNLGAEIAVVLESHGGRVEDTAAGVER
jgi:hypothetical protein